MNALKLWLSLFLFFSFLGDKAAFGEDVKEDIQPPVKTKKPNIIYFLIDDWGYNDVGYYGNTDSQTPFIDKLVSEESIRLDKYYVLPECTATRCALLTGRYPMRYGMQDGILYYQSTYALSRREFLLSNEFQNQGYNTHIVGKWHLGMMSLDYTPTYRGFDTFLGFYAGLIHYYSHLGVENSFPNKIDFKDGINNWHDEDKYTMYTYTDRILNILEDAADTQLLSNDITSDQKPFFLYVGWQGSHYPSEAPESYVNMYDTQSDESRKYFQAQTTLTDELFEQIVTQLKESNLWENTLLIVASDNGADLGYGDNSPFRGSKFTLWEGGVRVPAFITGGYVPETRRGSIINDFAMHVTDWYPTLLSAAKLNSETPNLLDGIDLWQVLINEQSIDESIMIKNDLKDDRYILLNVDSYGCGLDVCGGILYGSRWKLVTGTNQLVSFEGGSAQSDTCFWHRDFMLDEENDRFECKTVPEDVSTSSCECTQTVCLFDLENDPCEYYNVFDENNDIGMMLYEKLEELYNEQTVVLFDNTVNVATSIAAKDDHGGYWEPWCDTINDFDGWQSLIFEGILESNYYIDPSENDIISNNGNKRLGMVWIGIIVAACGVLVCGLLALTRYWCMWRKNQKLRARMMLGVHGVSANNDEEDENGRTDLQPERKGSKRGTFEENNPVFVGKNQNNIDNDETVPLKKNEVGSGNSYLTANIQTGTGNLV